MTDEEQIEIKHKTEFLRGFFCSLYSTISVRCLTNYIVITCNSDIAGLQPVNNEFILTQITKDEILTNICILLKSLCIQYKKNRLGILIDLKNVDLLCGVVKLYSHKEE